ncbi:MAG: hypothetical protein ABI725_03875 [Chloroflexota bacterium]
MLSFILRGGILALLLPIIVLPTQVEVRLMLGPNLGTSGFAPGFFVGVAVATIFSTALVMSVLYVLAWIEIVAYRRVATDPELEADTTPVRDPGARVRDLFVVESLTLVVLLLAAVPLAAALGQRTYQEILLPSSAASIYDRVLSHLAPPLAIFALALPIVDSISATWVRGVLSGQSIGSALARSVGAIVRRPLWFVASAALAWLLLTFVVVGADWALTVAWQATRAAFLATTSVSDMLTNFAPLFVALLLAGVFVCGLAICGYVASFRNALWTVTGLRR